MRTFKDLNLEPLVLDNFTDPKIDIKEVINKEIIIHAFKIKPSKFKDKNYLDIQIEFNKEKRVLWIEGILLTHYLKKAKEKDGFPFIVTIIRPSGAYEFR